jgi:hypothetical protein
MNWHIDTVPAECLTSLLARIRSLGGTIACSRRGADGVRVTWTTAGGMSTPPSPVNKAKSRCPEPAPVSRP